MLGLARTQELDDAHEVQQTHDLIRRIDLEGALGEVGAAAVGVMVVLEQLSHRHHIHRQRIARVVVRVEVAVAVFMPAPIHDGTVQRSHGPGQRQKKPLPRSRDEKVVERAVGPDPEQTSDGRSTELVQRRPDREGTIVETSLRLNTPIVDTGVSRLGQPHHGERIVHPGRRMRILLRVTVGVMLAMQDCIGARDQIRRALQEPGQEIEGLLPELVDRVHLVGGVTMQEKALHEDRGDPMGDEKDRNHHAIHSFETGDCGTDMPHSS